MRNVGREKQNKIGSIEQLAGSADCKPVTPLEGSSPSTPTINMVSGAAWRGCRSVTSEPEKDRRVRIPLGPQKYHLWCNGCISLCHSEGWGS